MFCVETSVLAIWCFFTMHYACLWGGRVEQEMVPRCMLKPYNANINVHVSLLLALLLNGKTHALRRSQGVGQLVLFNLQYR